MRRGVARSPVSRRRHHLHRDPCPSISGGNAPLATSRRPRYLCGMEQSRNIPPRYAIRLGDLRHWHVVTVTCPACGHKGRLDAAVLGRSRPGRPPPPGHTRLMDLERRLRCRRCGNRDDNRILVTLAPRE
jgi:DNA-directed RNA polymerase subunit RPC12/RpoP